MFDSSIRIYVKFCIEILRPTFEFVIFLTVGAFYVQHGTRGLLLRCRVDVSRDFVSATSRLIFHQRGLRIAQKMRIEALFLTTLRHAEQISSLGGQTAVSVSSSPQSGIHDGRRGHGPPKGPPLFLRTHGFQKLCTGVPRTNDSDLVQWQWCGGPQAGLLYRRRKAQSVAFVKKKGGARCGKGLR
jgi:hypothetical protein